MPGVLVEASSPALITKVRSSTTDANGHFQTLVLRDWSAAIPLTSDWETSKTLRPGERSDADVSYEVFGTRHNA